MSDTPFADYIARERERLHSERDQLFEQRGELDQKLAGIAKELRAVDAYEAAKTGKASRGPAPGGAPRARRGSRREEILGAIRGNPGLSRGELLEKMGLKGNKQGEMSVSNTLTALSKAGQVRRDGRKYRLGS
jgi:hypothetical protein